MSAVKIPVRLYLIHLIIMLAPAIFAVAIYFIEQPDKTTAPLAKEQLTIFQVSAAALALVAVVLAQTIARFFIRGETQIPLERYQLIKIVQWALLEGAAFFMGIIFYLSGERTMLMAIGILIALIAFMRPTQDELLRYNVRA